MDKVEESGTEAQPWTDNARKRGGRNGVKEMTYGTPGLQLLEGESRPQSILRS